MTDIHTQTLLQMLVAEHREIASKIADLRRFWSEVNDYGRGPKYEEMGSRVRELRRHLAQHFANEEHGGYLASALQHAPEFVAQAEQLDRQHAQFLDMLDDYVGRLQACECTYQSWQEVRVEFEDFLKHLHEHEEAETTIIETAVGNENGTAE